MKLTKNLSDSFGGLRDLIGRIRLSVVEIVFLSAALLFAGFAAFFYFNQVQPLSSELAARQERIKQLNARLEQMNTDERKRRDQASNAEKILESLRTFDAYLKPDERGMTEIINEVDRLGQTHKIIVSDSIYRVEEAEQLVDENGNPIPQPANKDKKPKIYPNLGIDTTVIGDYPNLRRFLSELERSRQFLVINSLSFQGGDEKVTRQLAKGGKQLQLSSPEAVPVTLKIEFDTFFQAPGAAKDGR
ncbi:MAG: GspMb/PilO family protein [Blastocatellia bacterium]